MWRTHFGIDYGPVLAQTVELINELMDERMYCMVDFLYVTETWESLV
jgi:hypothetical protein